MESVRKRLERRFWIPFRYYGNLNGCRAWEGIDEEGNRHLVENVGTPQAPKWMLVSSGPVKLRGGAEYTPRSRDATATVLGKEEMRVPQPSTKDEYLCTAHKTLRRQGIKAAATADGAAPLYCRGCLCWHYNGDPVAREALLSGFRNAVAAFLGLSAKQISKPLFDEVLRIAFGHLRGKKTPSKGG